MPVKSYKKVLVFLVAKALKDITSHSLKLAKKFSQEPIPLKANTLLYSNAASNLESLTFVKILFFPLTDKEKP